MAKILDMADEQQMVLRTEDLVKKYKTRTVVNHVSINVKQGEIVGLLGPNGAGKDILERYGDHEVSGV